MPLEHWVSTGSDNGFELLWAQLLERLYGLQLQRCAPRAGEFRAIYEYAAYLTQGHEGAILVSVLKFDTVFRLLDASSELRRCSGERAGVFDDHG
jgi:hypothetical protein